MSPDSADQEIEQIVSDYLTRKSNDETCSLDALIAAHPEYAEQLRIRLGGEVEKLVTTDWVVAGTEETVDSNSPARRIADVSLSHQPGMQIRHYRLLVSLGAGGFGTVWRARDSKLECDVAVKIPRSENLDEEEIKRFVHEARVSAQLRKHPHIVTVHEADWEGETAFIVSEFIEGQSLGERLRQAPLDANESAEMLVKICNALHFAHERGIIHRDLKPDNILLNKNNHPHVTDFGLAKKESQVNKDESQKMMGTIAYMSPEQARAAPELADRRSDVFSLGVVMYEMLTGERPFRGNLFHMLEQIRDADPPRLRSFNANIPLDLETICLKCLEKEPNRRYQTMEELSQDLERFQKKQPIKARPISSVGKLVRWCQRHPVIPWLSAVLILVVSASMVAAGFLLNDQVDTMQAKMVETAETTIRSLAFHAKRDAEFTLDRGAEIVREMGDQSFISALKDWNRIDWDRKGEMRSSILDQLGENWQEPGSTIPEPTLASLQAGLEKFDRGVKWKRYSFFVCDREGNQVARVVKKKTLGSNFSFRSYFTGRPNDLDVGLRADTPLTPQADWKDPRLSGIFVTETKEACVLAISIPVWSENGVEGVVGMFLELGSLIELPESLVGPDAQKVAMAIYDDTNSDRGIEANGFALLIDHPKLNSSLKQQNLDAPVKSFLPEADLSSQDATGPFVRMVDYHDPLSDSKRQKEWLAWRNREPILNRLYVVIQMPLSAIEEPGKNLYSNMTLLGVLVLGFAAVILVPLWVIVLRLLVKE